MGTSQVSADKEHLNNYLFIYYVETVESYILGLLYLDHLFFWGTLRRNKRLEN